MDVPIIGGGGRSRFPRDPSGEDPENLRIHVRADPDAGLVIIQAGGGKPVGIVVANALKLAHLIQGLALQFLVAGTEFDEGSGGPGPAPVGH